MSDSSTTNFGVVIVRFYLDLVQMARQDHQGNPANQVLLAFLDQMAALESLANQVHQVSQVTPSSLSVIKTMSVKLFTFRRSGLSRRSWASRTTRATR